MPANFWAQVQKKEHIALSFPDIPGTKHTKIELDLLGENNLSISLPYHGKSYTYHYHHRYLRLKDNPLHLTDEYGDTGPAYY